MAEILNVVLVGCGSVSNVWFKACAQFADVKIVGLVDVVIANAHDKAERFGLDGVLVDTDLEAVLEQCRPDIVFDCTVPEAHKNVVMTAAKHRCHILAEKPFADTMANARQMIAAVQEAHTVCAVMQNRRYRRDIMKVKEILDAGLVGSITTINSDFFIAVEFGGFRAQMDHVLLLDMAVHTFDAARMLTGTDPISVYCKDWNPAGSWHRGGASAAAIFDMTDGVVYNYRGSWCSHGLNTSWEAHWRIIGTAGSILWDGGDGIEVQTLGKQQGIFFEYRDQSVDKASPLPFEDHAGGIRDFLDCVKKGVEPATICTDNIKSLAMVAGAIRSAETAQVVQIEW